MAYKEQVMSSHKEDRQCVIFWNKELEIIVLSESRHYKKTNITFLYMYNLVFYL